MIYYERANQAMRTGDLSALNNTDYTFVFEKGKGGANNRILVAPNPRPGQSVKYDPNKPGAFKPIYNASDVAPFLTGIKPDEATQAYSDGLTGFKQARGFTLFGTYIPGDEGLDVYDPTIYTEENYTKRRGGGNKGGTTTTKPKSNTPAAGDEIF